MRSLLPFFALVLLLAGCSHREAMHANTVSTPELQIFPRQIWVGGGKLWVRTNVINNGPITLLVDRDRVAAHLPNGVTVGRASGRTTLHQLYTVPPGGEHAVWVEFEEAGFDWHDMNQVQIDFSAAITAEGRPLAIPPVVAVP